MLKNNFFTLLIVFVLLVAGGTYFYRSNFNHFLTPSQTKITPTPTLSPNTKTEAFTILGSNFTFVPDHITITKGDLVQITFKDTDGPHNLTIPDFKIQTATLSARKQIIVSFIADKAGTFPFYCSYAHHKEFGMTGKIIVK